jgi:zinc protease
VTSGRCVDAGLVVSYAVQHKNIDVFKGVSRVKNLIKVAFATLLVCGLYACNSSDEPVTTASAIETVEPVVETSPAGLSIDIEKYTLANGLDVILHRDVSDPVVATAIVYHVGSNREEPGRTGFAHFFEHMLFQDSENVGAGNFITEIGDMGGTLNGGTWQDGTIYFEVVPSDGLERVLWMESDRMGFFINTVTKAGLENEKQVVKNEKRQGVDNRPYGHTDYVLLTNMYPKGHPYSWDVIGSLEDLQAATVADVRKFYEKWYGVNNATLVLAGDFDPETAKRYIEKYFGELEPRGEVTPIEPMPATLDRSKKLFHEDNFAQLPELNQLYPAVETRHADFYALKLMASLLADGKDSPLYEVIVDEKKLAPSASAQYQDSEIAGTINFKVRAFDGIDLDSVQAALFAAFELFSSEGFTDQQLERILTNLETDFYNDLNSVFSKASELAQYNEFNGDPNRLATEIDRYRAVTREDIMRVFNTYVVNKNYVATSFVPKGQLDLAMEDSVKADVVEEQIVQGAEDAAESGEEVAAQAEPVSTPSRIDRSIKPEMGAAPVVKLPEVWTTNMESGLTLLGIEHNELPLVNLSVRIKGGHYLDNPTQTGTANLLTSIMMEGTAKRTPRELEQAIGDLGATINFSVSEEYITLTASSLARNFEAVAGLMEEILLQPRWDEGEWERVRQQEISGVQQAGANPDAVAADVFNRLLYGSDNILGTSVSGSEESLLATTIDDVKAFYQNNLLANMASVHIAGNVTRERALKAFAGLASEWQGGDIEFPVYAIPDAMAQPALYFVDIPGAKQSVIRIGSLAMKANSSDYYPATAINHGLGGNFSAQLFQVLRLQKGYTYGANSGFNRRAHTGRFQASSSVRSNVTLESMQTFRELLSAYGPGFDAAALARTKATLSKANATAFETTDSLMGVLQNISSYDLPTDYVAVQQQQLQDLNLEQASELFGKYMDPQKMIYLVVGDAETQLQRLGELGLGDAVLLDRKGDPVAE